MLTPKQYGKLRLCASLLVIAALIFLACTAVGSIIATGATKVPVAPVEEEETGLEQIELGFTAKQMRQTLTILDWYTLLQAKIGEPLPPDQLAQVTVEALAGRELDEAGLATRMFVGSSVIPDSVLEKMNLVSQQYAWDTAEDTPVEDRPEIKASIVGVILEMLIVVAALVGAYFGLRFAENGRKLAAVAFGSLFAVPALGLAIVRIWEHISLLIAAKVFDWLTLVGLTGYVMAALLIIAFYIYTYTAHRVKSLALWILALIFGIIAALCIGARTVFPVLSVMGMTETISAEAMLAFILLGVARLMLWLLTILALIFGMRRVCDREFNAGRSMFRALDAYRVNLRKERA